MDFVDPFPRCGFHDCGAGGDETWQILSLDFRTSSDRRQLVEQCLSALQHAGIQKCHIFILSQNQHGIAFWESVGWTPRDDISVISKTIEQNCRL